MKQILEEDLILKRFLLGELPERERSDVEERLFSDPEYFNQLCAAEDELIDEYLYGDLDAGEKGRFERHFLTTPERRESLKVARALQQYISKTGAPPAAEPDEDVPAPRPAKRSVLDILRGSFPRLVVAAAVVLVITACVWLAVHTGQRNKPAPPLQAKGPNAEPATPPVAQVEPGRDIQGQAAPPPPGADRGGDTEKGGIRAPRPPRRAPAHVYSFLILPLGQARGEGETNEVKLPARPGVVNLQMPLIEEAGYRSYQVTLQTEAGRSIKSWARLKAAKGAAGQTVSVNVPSRSLSEQNYRLILSGVSDGGEVRTVSTFHFKVMK